LFTDIIDGFSLYGSPSDGMTWKQLLPLISFADGVYFFFDRNSIQSQKRNRCHNEGFGRRNCACGAFM